MNKYVSSGLWQKLCDGMFSNVDAVDLNSFRTPGGGVNGRLATWDPLDAKTYRYYKNILYNLVVSQSERFYDVYEKIGNTSLGDPVEVSVGGVRFNLDYVFSAQEVMFLWDQLCCERYVVEIGAGFGRTCHAIVRNCPHLTRYTIIDLPEILRLSRKYLFEVLSRTEFEKVRFVENYDAGQVSDGGVYINIDSMQEMSPDVALSYLALIDRNASYFYSRNAVCKYAPESVGLYDYDLDGYGHAIKCGLCRDVVDIFDSSALEEAKAIYLDEYVPSSRWTLIKDEESTPWRYYHHALYAKNSVL